MSYDDRLAEWKRRKRWIRFVPVLCFVMWFAAGLYFRSTSIFWSRWGISGGYMIGAVFMLLDSLIHRTQPLPDGDDREPARKSRSRVVWSALFSSFVFLVLGFSSSDGPVERLESRGGIERNSQDEIIGIRPRTPREMRLLRDIPTLQVVDLNRARPADPFLIHLERLSKLRTLNLQRSTITEKGMEHLSGLTSLSFLDLDSTLLTDAGLKHLNGLANLRTLNLARTQLTDEGMVHLKGLANLHTLKLSDIKLTDAGLVHLNGLTNLQALSFRHTQLTDAGLVHLKGLAKLQTLDLVGTKITDAGVADLQKALPDCKIYK